MFPADTVMQTIARTETCSLQNPLITLYHHHLNKVIFPKNVTSDQDKYCKKEEGQRDKTVTLLQLGPVLISTFEALNMP